MARQDTRFDARWLSARLPGLAAGQRYVVALSGGADSSALASAIAEIAMSGEHEAFAVHINHGVHPDSDQWQAHCESLCERLRLPNRVLNVHPDPHSPLGPEAEWRRCRYRAFESVMSPGDILLTAHHRQDQAETLLLHLARGSGPDGLSGIPRERVLGPGRVYRPLLDLDASALRAYCKSQGIEWIHDTSNTNPDLNRGYLRQNVMPLLRGRWPAIDATLGNVARLQSEASEVLHHTARKHLSSLTHDGLVLPLQDIFDEPASVLALVIREWLQARELPPLPRARLQTFCAQLREARDDSKAMLSGDGFTLRLFQGALWLGGNPAPGNYRHEWSSGEALALGGGAGCLRIDPAGAIGDLAGLTVASRAGGERFDPGGGRPRRAVKDLLRESGIPPWMRGAVPLVSDADGVVAIGDWLVTERFRDRLQRAGARLCWEPGDALMATMHRRLLKSAAGATESLETTLPLG